MNPSKEKQENKVYHLRIHAYSTGYGNPEEKSTYHADLFLSLEEARGKGREYLNKAVQNLYKASDYCTGEKDGLTMEDFIKDKMVCYHFTVTEIDLELLQKYNPRKKFADIMPAVYHPKNRPPHTEYTYDLNGELLWRNYEYRDESMYACSYLHVREGDERPDAGTKFKPGDLVQLVRPLSTFGYDIKSDTEQIFVVAGEPRRDNHGTLVENTYHIETILKDGTYLWDLDFGYPFQGIHECELQLCNAELPPSNPLVFLQKLWRGEFENQEELVKHMELREYSFRNELSWREIPEFEAYGKEDNQ